MRYLALILVIFSTLTSCNDKQNVNPSTTINENTIDTLYAQQWYTETIEDNLKHALADTYTPQITWDLSQISAGELSSQVAFTSDILRYYFKNYTDPLINANNIIYATTASIQYHLGTGNDKPRQFIIHNLPSHDRIEIKFTLLNSSNFPVGGAVFIYYGHYGIKIGKKSAAAYYAGSQIGGEHTYNGSDITAEISITLDNLMTAAQEKKINLELKLDS